VNGKGAALVAFEQGLDDLDADRLAQRAFPLLAVPARAAVTEAEWQPAFR